MSKLPKNWAVATIDAVTAKPAQKVPHASEKFVYIDIGSVDRDTKKITAAVETSGSDAPTRARQVVNSGDVLVSMTRPNLNAVALVSDDLDGQIASTGFDVLRPLEVDPRWIFSAVRSRRFVDAMSALVQGALYPAVRPRDIRGFELPIPPVAEQKRITDKLDTVLLRVDACRERLDRVPVLLGRFRRSVLAAATTGRLTESWRQGKRSCFDRTKFWSLPQGYKRLAKQSFKVTPIDYPPIDLPNGWATSTIADLYDHNVIVDFADGNHGSLYPRKEDFDGKGALFLTASQINDRWGVAIEACPRLNHEKARLLVKGWAKRGDVLLTHNATVGRVAILEGVTEDVLLGTSVTFYRMNSEAYCPEFLKIVFSSPFFQDQLASVMSQTTRDQVPITKQVSLHVVCPPIDEQHEIVRRVELLLNVATQLEGRLEVAGDAMERLVPALLSTAFCGQLVPHDPNDEPAAELLKRLAKERSSKGTGTNGTRGKRVAPNALK